MALLPTLPPVVGGALGSRGNKTVVNLLVFFPWDHILLRKEKKEGGRKERRKEGNRSNSKNSGNNSLGKTSSIYGGKDG